MRYRGQTYEVLVPCPSGELDADALEQVVAEYLPALDPEHFDEARVYELGTGWTDARVYVRDPLPTGFALAGPAVLQQSCVTITIDVE